MLSHTYFIKTNSSYNPIEASDYFIFREYNRFIEKRCKPNCHQPKLFTLTGEILVQREKRPILTKETISNADIVLYQLGRLFFKSSGCWFPTTYIYHTEIQSMWQKMISKEYCERIKPLFGVDTIEELKALLSHETANNIGHEFCSRSVPSILSSISLDAIATKP